MDLSRHEQRKQDRKWRLARINRRWTFAVILLAAFITQGRTSNLILSGLVFSAVGILGGLWVYTRNLAAFLPIDPIELLEQSIEMEKQCQKSSTKLRT